MQLYEAKVADILRCAQRDEHFIAEAEDKLQTIFKLLGSRNHHKTRKIVPAVANIWYYLLTSLNNLQTLGEEYTGIVRINSNRIIPSKLQQSLWLVLYVGGEPLLERLLSALKTKIGKSRALTVEAKSFLGNCVDFLKEQKSTLNRIHHAIFYTNGKFYNISNRLMNIRYVLLRQWMQDDSFTASFNILGNISLFYIIFNFVQKLWASHNNGDVLDSGVGNNANISKRGCILCGENLKAASATPCGHIFCWNCIYESLEYQKSCPICRQEVNPNRIIFLQNYV